jgi:hypothetical protein
MQDFPSHHHTRGAIIINTAYKCSHTHIEKLAIITKVMQEDASCPFAHRECIREVCRRVVSHSNPLLPQRLVNHAILFCAAQLGATSYTQSDPQSDFYCLARALLSICKSPSDGQEGTQPTDHDRES